MSRARTLATVLGSDGTLGATEITTALGYTPVNKAGDTMSGNFNVVGSIGQTFSTSEYPSAIRKIYRGSFTNSTTLDLFTLNGSELPFAGTIYAIAYKSAEGVSGVWTACCIYPTVTPVVTQQSYVTRADEYITVAWSVSGYTPTLRVTMGNFSGATYYTIMIDSIVQQNYGSAEGDL